MNTEYWQERARGEYTYKGEKFYTITAIPYYVERRNIIINYLKKESQKSSKILDIGCGDGEYLYLLNETNKQYCGVDIAEEMLCLASKRCDGIENISFECSGDGAHCFWDYDMAYIVAVLAHINDKSMNKILKNTYDHMFLGGRLCICEQIAPYELKGTNWKRRTIDAYVKALECAGFSCESHDIVRIDFKVHRMLFERKIAKHFYKHYTRIECNKNKIYVLLSKICTLLSVKRIYKNWDGWGYCFITARKVNREISR